jgi:lysophospholipase-2
MHQVLLTLTARRRPIAIFSLTLLLSTAIFIASVFLQPKSPSSSSSSSQKQQSMAAARSFVLWLHGLGDSGPANEPIKTLFTSPEFRTTKWSFPSAPIAPVSCNCKPQAISLHIL